MLQTLFHQRLQSGFTWIIAVLIAVFVLFASICVFILLSRIEFPVNKNPEHNFYSKCEDCMFVVEGSNPSAMLNQGINFLYKDGSDEGLISHALPQSYFSDVFGDGHRLKELLESAGDEPFKFIIKDGEGSIAWAFSTSLSESGDVVDSLHKNFADEFSPAVIRERTVPTGRVVRDVVADPVGVKNYEEKWRSYRIRESAHADSGNTFVTAARGDHVALGNGKDPLLEVIESAPSDQLQFFASASGFYLFSRAFPDSDVLRHVRGILSKTYEGHLSLSSWQCIP